MFRVRTVEPINAGEWDRFAERARRSKKRKWLLDTTERKYIKTPQIVCTETSSVKIGQKVMMWQSTAGLRQDDAC